MQMTDLFLQSKSASRMIAAEMNSAIFRFEGYLANNSLTLDASSGNYSLLNRIESMTFFGKYPVGNQL